MSNSMCTKECMLNQHDNLTQAQGKLKEILDLFKLNFIKKWISTWSCLPSSNLLAIQRSTPNVLCSDREKIILMCDKNLGPAIMRQSTYMKMILSQYLQDNDNTYRCISERESNSRLSTVNIWIGKIVADNLSESKTENFVKTLHGNNAKTAPLNYMVYPRYTRSTGASLIVGTWMSHI